jgi:hypothetical protein
MNSDQQQAVEFLRRLATWIEDQTELEYLSCNKWGSVPSVIFSGILDMSERLRVKPVEAWLVKLTSGGIYCDTKDQAEHLERLKIAEYIRTVHLREVEE